MNLLYNTRLSYRHLLCPALRGGVFRAYKKLCLNFSFIFSSSALFAVCFSFFIFHSASAQVTANFSGSPLSGCSPLVVQFTDLSTGGPTAWSWDFGNSNTSSLQNPLASYTMPGTYAVTLTVTAGPFSDAEVKTNYILVYNKPVAGFTMSTDTACTGQTVTFTDATTISSGAPPIGTWAWDFGDGNALASTTSPVTHVYSNPGTFPVSVIVTDPNGCSHSVIKNIVVVPKPVTAFSGTPLSACIPPLTVTFTNNTSSVGQTTYTWNFGDGNTSTATNPVHTYTAYGTYNVTLIVNQNGCIDSLVMPNYVIIQNMVASFSVSPPSICSGDTFSFTNTSVPAATNSSWNFGDASTSTVLNPTHIYTSAGTYTVTLISSDATGCADTTSDTVVVNVTPLAAFSSDTQSACSVPFTVNFTDNSTGSGGWNWNFGDGGTSTSQNPAHTYTAAGTYTVSLIVTNASGTCSDTVVMNSFIVISFPVASFTTSPDSGCVPLTVNFDASGSSSPVDPISNYVWIFGDGSTASTAVSLTSHTYTATGVYSVTLIIQTANGCSDTMVCNNCIKVGIPPVADFGILQDTVCFGLPVNFSDSSTGPVTGWYWSFGDGGSSTQQNPQYTYGDTGTFQVYLVAYNNGCADTSLIQNVVILPPKAEFTYTLSCTNYYTVMFTNTSDGADSVVWNFGDGTIDSSNIDNPVHTYPSRGPITVILTAYNYATGCSHFISASFNIAEPIASFSVTNTAGCYPFTANYTSTSQDANILWWNFGDPSTLADTATVSPTSYTYSNTGQYITTLIITDVNGCRDTITDTLKAFGPYPYFYADTLTGCRPFPVTFIDTSISDSTLVEWIWNFGDGTIDTTNNDSIVHVYTIPGVYSVTMSVRDTNGCINTITINSYVQPTFPYPAFTVDTFACKGDVLTFNAGATAVVGGTYVWDFGDGTGDTTTANSTTHAYASDSLYVVTLTVTDTNGCDSTITDTVLILKPTADFGWNVVNMGCGNLLVHFTDSSSGYPVSLLWNFGDGGSATTLPGDTSIYHQYTVPGIYSVTLIVTNGGGCIDTIQLDSIVFVPGPVGNFTIDPDTGCNPFTACFDANSTNTQDYIWDFGDGTVITTQADTICHTYTNAGVFNPILLLQSTLPNGNPCILQAPNNTGPVVVTNVINLSLSGPYSIVVPQDSIISVTATFSGGSAPYTYAWTPNTGINCDTCTSVLIIGTGDTVFYVFTVYDNTGCIGQDSILILSEPCFENDLVPNVFTPNADGFNDMFYIPGICPNENFFLQIFDRWGVLLFTTTLRNNGWDGRTNSGIEARDGVYYYVVKVNDETYKGFVHLER